MRPWVFDDEFLRISHNFPSRELKLVYSIKKTIFLISVFSTFDLQFVSLFLDLCRTDSRCNRVDYACSDRDFSDGIHERDLSIYVKVFSISE